eukprot:243451-Ditylum_brightwellii.AAC.1
MRPFQNAIVRKMGFNKYMPHAVVHSANLYGAFEFAHLFYEQGMIATKQLIGHLREKVITGQQLQVLISKVQLVNSSVDLYLKDMVHNFDYVPDTHITGVHHFLQLCGGVTQVYDTWKPKTQQRNDIVLMD